VFLLVEPPRPSLPFDPVFLVPALPPVLTRPIGRSLPYGPHQHHHRALNPILGFSNDPGRNGFDTPAVAALNGCAKITRRRAELSSRGSR